MLPDYFLHPYHVVPSAEFEAAFMKAPCKAIAHALMETSAVVGEIFVVLLGVAYAGV